MVKDIDDMADEWARGIQSTGEQYHDEFLLKRPKAEWAPYIDETAKDLSSGIQIGDLTLSKNNFGQEVGGFYRRGLKQTVGRHADLPSVLDDDISDKKLGRLAYQLNEFSHEISDSNLGIEDVETATEAVIEKVLTRHVGQELSVSFDLSGVTVADVTTQLFKNRTVASNVDLLLSEFQQSLGSGLLSLMDQPQMMTPLWSHQRDALAEWADQGLEGYVDMATATGKTVLGLAAIALTYGQLHPDDQRSEIDTSEAASIGETDDVLIVAHSELILEQWRREFETHLNIPQERTAGEEPITLEWGQVHFKTAQSLLNQDRVSYDLVLLDEAHHYATGSEWGSLLEEFDNNILAMSGSVDDAGSDSQRIKERLTNSVGPELTRYTVTDARADGVIPSFDWEVHYAPYDANTEDLKQTANRAERAFSHFREQLSDGELNIDTDRRLRTYQDIRRFSHTSEGSTLKKQNDRFRDLVTRLFSRRTKRWNLSPVIESVLELISDHHASEKVVVLADSNAQVKQIESGLQSIVTDPESVYRVSGSQDLDRQHEIITEFDEPDTTGTLLGTGDLLGEGVDMQRASVAINMATGGVNQQLVQRIGRVLRNPVDTPKHAIFYNVVGVTPTSAGAVTREDGKQLVEQAAGFCSLGRRFDKLPHFSIAEKLDTAVVSELLNKGSEFISSIDADGLYTWESETVDRKDLSALLNAVDDSADGATAIFDSWNDHATQHSKTREEFAPDATSAEKDTGSPDNPETSIDAESEQRTDPTDAESDTVGSSEDSSNPSTSDDNLGIVTPTDSFKDGRVSETALLSDITRVESTVGDVPTKSDMKQHGRYTIDDFETAFGTWSGAVREAGFVPHGSARESSYSRADVVEQIQRVDNQVNSTPTTTDINEHAPFSSGVIYNHFDSIGDARDAAGVTANSDANQNPRSNSNTREQSHSRADIIKGMQRVAERVSAAPSTADIDKYAPFSSNTIYQYFDSIEDARSAAKVETTQMDGKDGYSGAPDTDRSDTDPEIEPSPLSEYYEALYRLFSLVETMNTSEFSPSTIENPDAMDRWEAELEDVLSGDGMTADSPNYGSQQSARVSHSIKDYRSRYGDTETVHEYRCIDVESTDQRSETILSSEELHDGGVIHLPIAPGTETHLPIVVDTEEALTEAIDLLHKLPAEPNLTLPKQSATETAAEEDTDLNSGPVQQPPQTNQSDPSINKDLDPVDAQTDESVFWDGSVDPITRLEQASADDSPQQVMGSDPLDSKIDEWKSQLLDLTRRNNLISFSPTKTKSLPFEESNPTDVATTLDGGADIHVHRRVTNESADADNQLQTKSDAVAESELIPTREETEAEHSLNQISIRNKQHLRERGVNSLYLSLGMLRWYDVDHSDEANRSPMFLAPIELEAGPVRDSNLLDHTITGTPDTLILNPALRKKLAAEHGLDLPADDAISLATIDQAFEAINRIVSGFDRWSIEAAVIAGIFDFTKLSLYSDIERNRARIANHHLIRALNGDMKPLNQAEGDIQTPRASELDDTVDPVDTYQVLDADSSQQEAIEAAKRGKSFVLQGPPGTGKSQTIANIISEKIAAGEKVLFVSEKQAALDVVKQRLTDVGVGRFCLEIHGEKAAHGSVLDQLKRELQSDSVGAVGERHRSLQRLQSCRSRINEHGESLFYSPDKWNITVYQAYGIVSAHEEAPRVSTGIHNPLQLSQETVDTAIGELETLARFDEEIRTYKSSPWRHTTLRQWGIDTGESMRRSLKRQIAAVEEVSEIRETIASVFGIRPDSISEFREVCEILQHFAERPEISWREQFFTESFAQTGQQLEEFADLAQERDSLVADLCDKYDEEVLSADGVRLKKELSEYGYLKSLRPGYRSLKSELTQYATPAYNPSHAQLVEDARQLAEIQRLTEQTEIYEETKDALGPLYDGRQTDWETLISAQSWISELATYDIPVFADGTDLLTRADSVGETQLATQAQTTIEKYDRAAEFFEASMSTGEMTVDGYTLTEAPLSTLAEVLRYLLERVPQLQDRVQFLSQLDRVRKTVCGEYCNQFLEQEHEPETLVSGFKRQFYTQWLTSVYSQTTLGAFNADKIQQDIEDFQRLDTKQQELAQTAVQHRVTARRPGFDFDTAATTERATLRREIEKERNYKPLRELFDEAGPLISLLTPCFMMSPLSVAENLKVDSIDFDTVVFDEASQIMPQDAVSSLIRADQAILAGDSNQLPPTAFFQSDVDTTEDVREDLDSILEETASVLPEKSLRWHYRSRSEELIQFSNHHYYDNSLRTFPENEPKVDTGVEFEYVEYGMYDRGGSRQNVVEADRVVDLVQTHAENHGDKSLGVVAFSSAQEQAIRDSLAKRREEDTVLDRFVGQDGVLEEFFIKNLEMVQGDERDRMIFSVGYGPTRDGTISTNFGPLNKSGGERRLNVAVTRAKEKVTVVCSMQPGEIDLSGSNSVGAQHFKNYLEYAKTGERALARQTQTSPTVDFDSQFEEAVYDALQQEGYDVVSQVQSSSYSIDLAIKHPQQPGKFVLGIECDGAAYHSSKTARDRDRTRQLVLENLGWDIHRIWSPDWASNKARQIELIDNAVDSLVDTDLSVVKSDTDEPRDTASKPENIVDDDAAITEYGVTTLQSETRYSPEAVGSQQANKNVIKDTVIENGPMKYQTAIQRYLEVWSESQVTDSVRQAFDSGAAVLKRENTIAEHGEFLWPSETALSFDVRVNTESSLRHVQETPLEEISKAAYLVADGSGPIVEANLIEKTGQLLGYDTITTEVEARLKRSIQLLQEVDAIEQSSADQYVVNQRIEIDSVLLARIYQS